MRKSHGLSPLIATVLLVAFTIAVGGIVSSWVTGLSREQTSKISDKGGVAVKCTDSRLFFSKNDITANGSRLSLDIKNEGSVNQTSFLVYLTNVNNTLLSYTTMNNFNITLQPGQIVQLYNISANLNKSDIKQITVSTGPTDACPGTSWTVKL